MARATVIRMMVSMELVWFVLVPGVFATFRVSEHPPIFNVTNDDTTITTTTLPYNSTNTSTLTSDTAALTSDTADYRALDELNLVAVKKADRGQEEYDYEEEKQKESDRDEEEIVYDEDYEKETRNGTQNETSGGYIVVYGPRPKPQNEGTPTGQQTGVIVIGVFLLVSIIATMSIALHQNRRKNRSANYRLPHPINLRTFPHSRPGSPKASSHIPLTAIRPYTTSISDPETGSWTDLTIPPSSPNPSSSTYAQGRLTTESQDDDILSAFPTLANVHTLFPRMDEDDRTLPSSLQPTPSVRTARLPSPISLPVYTPISTAHSVTPLSTARLPSEGYPLLPSPSFGIDDDDSSEYCLFNAANTTPAVTPGAKDRMAAVVAELQARQSPLLPSATLPAPTASTNDLWDRDDDNARINRNDGPVSESHA